MAASDYVFYDTTISLCSTCLRKVEAKIVIQDERVYMTKRCPRHGDERVLIASDAAYYKKCRDYGKAGDMPKKRATTTEYGCPYDCGLCPDHEQHSCVSLIEVTDRCNLRCPTCYAESGPGVGRHKTLAEIAKMMDTAVAAEGEPDVVQISGGEPTIHPDFFAILDLAKERPIKHLMVNTNGLRIAQDAKFAKRLAEYKRGLELYLQFDSLEAEPLVQLRGEDLREVRKKALAILNELNISTTLVVTVQKGLNTHELGAIVDFALTQRCVRGVTFQPTQIAGRLDNFDPAKDRYTLTEARADILAQTSLFTSDDLIPVPCHPEGIAMGYALKFGDKAVPLSRFLKPEELMANSGNTINFERDPRLKTLLWEAFSTSKSVDTAEQSLRSLLCCLPQVEAGALSYDNVFRVVIVKFFDAYDFDIRPIKKTCVHIVQTDGRMIPFDTMNLLYRGDRQIQLAALRKEEEQVRAIRCGKS